MSEGEDISDAQLIAAAKSGERRAFDELVARHVPRLLILATRMLSNEADAQDAVQNAMASAWLALHRFDEARSVAPWLTTITLNKCRDAMRARRLRNIFGFEADDRGVTVADPHPGQDSQMADRQALALVREEITRLPSNLKEPFVLVTFDGRSQAEAAQILGITEKAVETRIYRARARLKERFAKS